MSECQVNKLLLPPVYIYIYETLFFVVATIKVPQSVVVLFFLSSRVVHHKGEDGNLRFSRYGWAAAHL